MENKSLGFSFRKMFLNKNNTSALVSCFHGCRRFLVTIVIAEVTVDTLKVLLFSDIMISEREARI